MSKPIFACMECGHKFRTVSAAERASNRGCPKCGGVDIDFTSERENQVAAIVAKQECP